MSWITDNVFTRAADAATGAVAGFSTEATTVPQNVKARIYRKCLPLPLLGNASNNHLDIDQVGTFDENYLLEKGLKDNISGVRPGKGFKVTLRNPPETNFIVTSETTGCLADNWLNQTKSFVIEAIPIPAEKEGFGHSMSMLVNILLLILILFIVYRIVMQMK